MMVKVHILCIYLIYKKNMKYLLIVLVFLTISCSSTKESIYTYDKNFSIKNEINQSIIDGFYNGDTTGVSKNIYF